MALRSRPAPSRTPAAAAGGEVRQSLSAQAYEALRHRLRTGRVPPGDRLIDLEIAAELGMSRMPVREALLQLVSEGCLESTTRGYRIPALDRQAVLEVFELRQLLDPRAAAMAARDIDRAGIQRLAAALMEAKSAATACDFGRLFEANQEFRDTWVGAVSNQRLATAISRFADQILLVRHLTLREPAIHPVVIEGLNAQYQALRRHDSIAAQEATVRFVLAAERAYLDSTDKHPFPPASSN